MSRTPEELGAKIREAKNRPPEESPLPKSDLYGANSTGLRMGTDFIASIAVGVFLGYWVDRWFGIQPFGMIAFLFLGFISGVMRMQRLQAQETAKEDKKEPEKAVDTTKDHT
ncbi:MAG: AtpZ/AtpI family protein [Alphaproteobacteria bacterium]|nr:AtpZ/AtpI family protein [Alphaproteobacteria bacterium]MDE2336094.1 AtpZ/AtpI family protein [Alphaproteobacteria bacterium]